MLQSRFKKISFDDLAMAIINCDWNVLSASDVNALKQNIPTPDEVSNRQTHHLKKINNNGHTSHQHLPSTPSIPFRHPPPPPPI